jgi:hypothetical protein
MRRFVYVFVAAPGQVDDDEVAGREAGAWRRRG